MMHPSPHTTTQRKARAGFLQTLQLWQIKKIKKSMKAFYCCTFLKLLVYLIITFISNTLQSQNTSLNDKVATAKNEPIAYATVSLLNAADTTLIKVTITKEDGTFQFKETGTAPYLLKIESLGYQPQLVAPTERYIVITMIEMAQELEAVQVTAKKPIVQVLADKTVFNVENTLSAAGITGFDLLRKAPGVVIDNNENLIVEGKTGVLIYIDGKPSVLQGTDLNNFLKSLQSTDIEAIEIITQPSSKYDAAGNAGIVNIKLKKDKSLGTNGSITAGYAVGRFAKYNASASFNNRTKGINLFGTVSNRVGNNYSFINLFRIQNNTVFDSRSQNETYGINNNIRLGADLFASSKSTFGFIFNGNFNNYDSFNNSRTPIIPQNNENPQQVLIAQGITEGNSQNLNANLNYRFADTLGHSVNVDVDYGTYRGRRFNLQPNFYFNGEETIIEDEFIFYMETPINIEIASAKADYEQNFFGGKLGVGFKTSLVNTDNTFLFFDVVDGQNQPNTNRSNNFAYKENINAAYINFNRKWNKTNVQLGLRAEQTISDGKLNSQQQNSNERVKRNYTNLFPSGGITQQITQNHQMALTYSKRIERPTYQSLNPFEMQIDELSFSRGNPFLQPQYTDNVKLSHTYKYTLNTSISYSLVSDFFAQVTDAEGENRSFIQTRNIANQEVINFGISYPFNPKKWWNVFFSLNAFHSSFKAKDENFVPISQNTLSFYGQNNFTLPKGFQLEISGWYSSPSVWGGTYETRSLGSLDAAVQKKFFKDQLNLRVAVSDIFFTSPWQGDTRFGNVFIRGNGGWESRQFRVNLSYNFGSKEVKSARKRNTGIDDENKRIE